jgi:hypothetical protein
MGTQYSMFCNKCQVLSVDTIGQWQWLYKDNMAIAFIKKHWHCDESRDGIKPLRIVNCDTYGMLDYKLDDGKEGSLPFWHKMLTIKKPEERLDDR